MKALGTRDKRLSGDAVLRAVPLVRLTTYGDSHERSDATSFYFSDRYTRAGWSGTRQFYDLLVRIDPQLDRITHIPLPELAVGGLDGPLRRTMSLALRSYDAELGFVLDWLTSSGARDIRGALVEIHDLLLQGGQLGEVDLSSGVLRIPLYAGRVETIEAIDDELRLRLSVELPALIWQSANQPSTNDPEQLGRRLPLVVGSASKVECTGWQVGATSTLIEEVAAGVPLLELTDASAFDDSGSGLLGPDTISWTAKSGNQLQNVSGLAHAHGAGATLIEIPTSVVFVASSVPAKAIDAVYVLSPFTDELIRLDASAYSVGLMASGYVTAAQVAAITFDSTELEAVLRSHAAGVGVVQQPKRSTDVITTGGTPFTFGFENTGSTNVAAGTVRDAANVYSEIAGISTDAEIEENGELECTFTSDQSTATRQVTAQTISFRCGKTGNQASLEIWSGSADSGVLIDTITDDQLDAIGGGGQTFSYNLTGAAADTDTITFRTVDTDVPGTYCRVQSLDRDNGAGVENAGITQQPEVSETSPTEVAISGAAQGFGLKVYADVQGAVALPGFSEVHDFDDADNYSVSGLTATLDGSVKVLGSAVKIAAAEATPVYSDDMDSITPWTGSNATLANEATIVAPDGSTGSVKGTSTATGGFGSYATIYDDLSAVDFSGKILRFWIRGDSFGSLAANEGVLVQIDSTVGVATSFWEFGTSDGVAFGEWVQLTIDFDNDTPTGTGGGGANLSAINRIYIGILHSGVASHVFYVDSVEVRDTVEGIAQKNAPATLGDWSSDSDRYRLQVRGSGLSSLERLEIHWSDEIETGTTAPSASKQLSLTASDLMEDEFVLIDLSTTDDGSPTVAAVRTLRVELDTDGKAAVDVWLDVLQSADDSASPYDAAVGDLLEEGPDIVRYFLTELSKPAQTVDDAAFALAATNLGSNIFGGDLRLLGASWAAVLEQLAACTRSNIVARDASSGPVWHMFAADASSEWPAAVATVTEWTAIAQEPEEERPPTEILHLYAYDASLAARAAIGERPWLGLVESSNAAEQAKRGRNEADPVTFPLIEDDSTATQVAGDLGTARIEPGRLFRLQGVPHVESFALEIGDVVSLTLPANLGGDAISKLRVVGLRRDFDTRDAELVLREVA